MLLRAGLAAAALLAAAPALRTGLASGLAAQATPGDEVPGGDTLRATPDDEAAPPAARDDTLPGIVTAHGLPGGGRLLVYRQPESELVAIRVSFPLAMDGGPSRALARMADWLAREDLERRAATYGARVDVGSSADHASFAIVGAATDAGALAAVLRQGLAWDDWNERDVRTARFIEAARTQRRTETPEPLLRDRLAFRLFPALPPTADSTPARLNAAMLHSFWDRTFRADRMEAVVVGRVTDAQAVAMLEGWPAVAAASRGEDSGSAAAGAADDAGEANVSRSQAAGARQPGPPVSGRGGRAPAAARRSTPAAPSRPQPEQEPASSVGQPQILYPWAAVGWATEAEPAVAAVAARLVASRLSTEALRLARAELWWSDLGRALVAIGSAAAPDSAGAAAGAGAPGAGVPPRAGRTRAPARADAPGAPRPPQPGPAYWLEAALADAARTVSAEEVQAARLALSREILLSARTPEGLARYLGEMFERTHRPASAQQFLRQLARVDVRAVRKALASVGEPRVVEVHR